MTDVRTHTNATSISWQIYDVISWQIYDVISCCLEGPGKLSYRTVRELSFLHRVVIHSVFRLQLHSGVVLVGDIPPGLHVYNSVTFSSPARGWQRIRAADERQFSGRGDVPLYPAIALCLFPVYSDLVAYWLGYIGLHAATHLPWPLHSPGVKWLGKPILI